MGRVLGCPIFGDIGKRPVSVVVIEEIRVTRQAARTAHDRHTLPLAVVCVAGRGNLVWIQLDVVADK